MARGKTRRRSRNSPNIPKGKVKKSLEKRKLQFATSSLNRVRNANITLQSNRQPTVDAEISPNCRKLRSGKITIRKSKGRSEGDTLTPKHSTSVNSLPPSRFSGGISSTSTPLISTSKKDSLVQENTLDIIILDDSSPAQIVPNNSNVKSDQNDSPVKLDPGSSTTEIIPKGSKSPSVIDISEEFVTLDAVGMTNNNSQNIPTIIYLSDEDSKLTDEIVDVTPIKIVGKKEQVNKLKTPINALPANPKNIFCYNEAINKRKMKKVNPMTLKETELKSLVPNGNSRFVLGLKVNTTQKSSSSNACNLKKINRNRKRSKSPRKKACQSEENFKMKERKRSVSPLKTRYFQSKILEMDALSPKTKLASVGNNIYTDAPIQLPSSGLRPIIIDGSNVAFHHSNNRFFSCRGLEICINYFKMRGHKVTAFVPQFRVQSYKCDNPRLLNRLARNGDVILTPSREVDNLRIVSYDDRFIVQAAALKGGIIVTRDNYNDLLKESPAWADTIKYRILQFTWVDDLLMFPQDPLGEKGPSLEEFLSFT